MNEFRHVIGELKKRNLVAVQFPYKEFAVSIRIRVERDSFSLTTKATESFIIQSTMPRSKFPISRPRFKASCGRTGLKTKSENKTIIYEINKSCVYFKSVFCAYDAEKLYTYTYFRKTVNGTVSLKYLSLACLSLSFAGSQCQLVGATKLPFGYKPLMLYNGDVSCQTPSGKVSVFLERSRSIDVRFLAWVRETCDARVRFQ